MMTKKTATEIKAEVAALVKRLPDGWLAKEITVAKGDPKRHVKTLEMLAAALEDNVKKKRPKKRSPRKRATRAS
jgi:hypothetical protein